MPFPIKPIIKVSFVVNNTSNNTNSLSRNKKGKIKNIRYNNWPNNLLLLSNPSFNNLLLLFLILQDSLNIKPCLTLLLTSKPHPLLPQQQQLRQLRQKQPTKPNQFNLTLPIPSFQSKLKDTKTLLNRTSVILHLMVIYHLKPCRKCNNLTSHNLEIPISPFTKPLLNLLFLLN